MCQETISSAGSPFIALHTLQTPPTRVCRSFRDPSAIPRLCEKPKTPPCQTARLRFYRWHDPPGLASFRHEGGACRLSDEQQEKLKAWIREMLPRTTREVGAWIEKEFSIEYESRCGLVALLHRLGMEHRKPKTVSRKLDPEVDAQAHHPQHVSCHLQAVQ